VKHGSPKQHKSLETQHHLFIFRRLLSLELQWLFLLLRSITRCGLALHQQTHQPQRMFMLGIRSASCHASSTASRAALSVAQSRSGSAELASTCTPQSALQSCSQHTMPLQLRLNRTSKDNQVYERMASAYRGKDRSTGPPPWMKFRMVKEVRQLRFFLAMHSPFTVAGRPLFSGTA
jgi:hypothetical protein